MSAVVFAQVVPSKLYPDVVFIPAPAPSLAPAIVNVPVVHSLADALAKVNVGAVIS